MDIIQEVKDDAQMLYTKKDVIELLKRQKIECLTEHYEQQIKDNQLKRQLHHQLQEYINTQINNLMNSRI